MLKENKVYEIQITDMGHSGEGIGRLEGIIIFVDGVLIGDQAKVRIVKMKKKYAVGELLEISKPSKDRIVPICSVSALCGGCQIMAMNYLRQVEFKRSIVREALRRIGKFEGISIPPVIGMDVPLHYRNKSQYPLRKKDDGEIEIGFFRKKSHDIVPMDKCYIDSPISEMLICLVKEWIVKNDIKIYDENVHQGNLRQIVLRTAQYDAQIMLIFVTKERNRLRVGELIETLQQKIPSASFTVIQNINEKKTNVILGEENWILYGKGYIQEELRRLFYDQGKRTYIETAESVSRSYRIYPSSFFQVNTRQTEILYSLIVDFASIDQEDIVFDLYCGLGSISLFLAQKAKLVYGIEIVEEAIQGAIENAKNNHLVNLKFKAGKTEEILPELIRQGIKPDIVVLDPPRKGCEASVLQTILKAQPRKIVYVSCNPSTLARDLNILTENAYQLEKVQAVDLFPNTVHVETVALLSKLDVDKHISVKIELDELDLTSAESKATYE